MSFAFLAAVVVAAAPAEAAPGCSTSGPSSGAYAVTVCVNAPISGATLSGQTTVTATATVTGTSPGVRRVVFSLNGTYVLTDFASPWGFSLNTAKWVDGAYTLEAEAVMQDNFVGQRTSIPIVLQNGVLTPPVNPNSFTPRTGTTPAPGAKFRVAAVGDGAGGRADATNVVNGIAASNPNLFLYLGDVYEKGSPSEFANWYGPQGTLFGRFRDITNPTIGNHEYEAKAAPGYFDYWDNVPDYYSYNAGGWHFISLNSTSQLNQTSPGSAQYQWLENDLATNGTACTVVYFHHPVLSVGPQGSSTKLPNMWRLMADWGVDVVLTAHDHNYQRWTPLDRNLNPDPAGVTQFVVGGGGHGIQSFVASDPRMVLGLDSTTTGYGSLQLDLDATSANFQFVNPNGTVRDSGAIQCSAATPDTNPPTSPSPLSAVAVSSGRVDLTWGGSSDNYGVAGYTVYRDDSVLATVGGAVLGYTDVTVNPATTYRYTVDAFDAAGNRSVPSNGANVTTPAVAPQIRVNPVADSYVDGSKPTTNYGTNVTLRADASPDLRSYLRFAVAGVNGTVISATLRVYANANHSTGFRVHGVSDNTWTETGLVYNNAPAVAATVIASSGSLSSGVWKDVDITPLITGNGTYNIAITTTSSSSLSLGSRQSTNLPELVIDYTPSSNSAPNANPVTVSTAEDQPIAWTPSVSDPNGDPLTCSITTQPTRGTATVAPNCSSGTYTPAADDNGTVVFTYSVADATLSATAGVTVNIAPVNDAPRANAQTLTVISGSPFPIALTGSDVDGDCPLTFTIVTQPVNGSLNAVDGPACSTGVAAFSMTYTATAGFSGTDSFQFTLSDPAGATSTVGVIALDVRPAPSRTVLNPVADSYVDGSKVTTNYGTNVALRADASPDLRSYLRFTVTGVSGTVTRATLRVYANANHSTGFRVHDSSDNSWTETGLTFGNAPTFNPTFVAASGALTSGAWKDIDITPLITGNGTYNIVITTTSNSSLSLGSRQSANSPELVVDYTPS